MIGFREDRLRALGVRRNERVGMIELQLDQGLVRELLVHDAGTRPQHHRPPGGAHEVRSQMPVGREEDRLVGRYLAQNAFGRRRGDDHVGQCLHGRGAVDVRHRHRVRIAGPPPRKGIGWARFLERAPCLEVRDQNLGRRVQDLGDLGHEADTAECDHLGVGPLRGPGEFQGVADEVCNVLDFCVLVVVREDDGFPLPLQA